MKEAINNGETGKKRGNISCRHYEIKYSACEDRNLHDTETCKESLTEAEEKLRTFLIKCRRKVILD